MIDVYTKNMGGVWFGTACSEQRVFSTAFVAVSACAICVLSLLYKKVRWSITLRMVFWIEALSCGISCS
jgi:hypothetical protein